MPIRETGIALGLILGVLALVRGLIWLYVKKALRAELYLHEVAHGKRREELLGNAHESTPAIDPQWQGTARPPLHGGTEGRWLWILMYVGILLFVTTIFVVAILLFL
jgi:hypothetical protein